MLFITGFWWWSMDVLWRTDAVILNIHMSLASVWIFSIYSPHVIGVYRQVLADSGDSCSSFHIIYFRSTPLGFGGFRCRSWLIIMLYNYFLCKHVYILVWLLVVQNTFSYNPQVISLLSSSYVLYWFPCVSLSPFRILPKEFYFTC